MLVVPWRQAFYERDPLDMKAIIRKDRNPSHPTSAEAAHLELARLDCEVASMRSTRSVALPTPPSMGWLTPPTPPAVALAPSQHSGTSLPRPERCGW